MVGWGISVVLDGIKRSDNMLCYDMVWYSML